MHDFLSVLGIRNQEMVGSARPTKNAKYRDLVRCYTYRVTGSNPKLLVLGPIYHVYNHMSGKLLRKLCESKGGQEVMRLSIRGWAIQA